MEEKHLDLVLEKFKGRFAGSPRVFRAPGRVNLIGEHTDYNGGFVLPAAIPLETRVELAPASGRRVRVWSAQFANQPPVTYDLGAEARAHDWADYVRGVTWSLASVSLPTPTMFRPWKVEAP